MSGRILVIGDVMTDIVVMPQGMIARGTDVRATIRHMPGGSGANQAVWLAAQGADVRFVSRVGAGDVSALTAYFNGRGVNALLSGDTDLGTGALICLVDPDGERSFLTDKGANAALGAEDLPQALLDGVSILHISAYALFEDASRIALISLMKAARARGVLVSIDPASTGFLQEIGADSFLEWTSDADYIFPNAEEAALLTQEHDPAAQLAVLSEHYRVVVLKCGPKGAMLGGKMIETMSLPGHLVEVIDTTGAGDAFAAGFLAAHLRGDEAADCLANAIRAGADAVSRIGAQPS